VTATRPVSMKISSAAGDMSVDEVTVPILGVDDVAVPRAGARAA
jgi:hypothetical protein